MQRQIRMRNDRCLLMNMNVSGSFEDAEMEVDLYGLPVEGLVQGVGFGGLRFKLKKHYFAMV